jgi:hypothetical protein
MNRIAMAASVVLLSSTCGTFAHAAAVTVDCAKKGNIQAAVDKLDKSLANSVTIVGACTENVTISRHRDLTIIGGTDASLTAAAQGATLRALGSSISVRDLVVSGGGVAFTAVACEDRSTCILENVSARDAQTGVGVQKQSTVDIIGSPTTVITGNSNAGIGVFGQSSANIGPAAGNDQPGITISGNVFGIQAIDGSFVRVENAQIINNTDSGLFGDRGTVFKVFGTNVSNNGGEGAFMRASTLQVNPQFGIAATFANNARAGVFLGSLSYATIFNATFVANGGPYPAGVDCSPSAVLRNAALFFGANANTTCGE